MRYLNATLSGPRGRDRFYQFAQLPCFSACLPANVSHGFENVAVTADWANRITNAPGGGAAFWSPSQVQLEFAPKSDGLVAIGVPLQKINLDDALALIEPVPFELCAFGSAFHAEWIAADYRRWGFSRSNISHGWACAFRGPGHERLVSRRWLDFGPWRVIRRPNDTTLIQFHDLAITDPAEAYEQAKVGHERMGISATGGFIQHTLDDLVENVRGIYLPELRRLEIVIPPGESVEQYAMKCACAVRLYYRRNPDAARSWNPAKDTIGPTDSIAYIFIDEPQARAHLHELWLRELECWVVDGQGKRRLDDDYHPVPDPPEWVRRLG